MTWLTSALPFLLIGFLAGLACGLTLANHILRREGWLTDEEERRARR